MGKLFAVLLLVTVSAVVSGQYCSPPSSGVCPEEQSGTSCCRWVPEHPGNQTVFSDHTLNFTQDTTCRPLGFVFGTYYYQKRAEFAQPCVTIGCDSSSSGNCQDWVVVHVQTAKQLCAEFRVNDADQGNPVCQDTDFSFCKQIPGTVADTVDIKFYCTSCAESDVSFWYRLITFTPQDGQDGNDFCGLFPNAYPDSLIPLPVGQDPQNNNPALATSAPSAAPRSSSVGVAFLLLGLTLALSL